jgi:hypothetical protein
MATTSKQITLSNILDEVVALRKEVQELKSTAKTSKGSGASKAPKKPKDPNAPPKAPNTWIVFTGKVRDALTSAGKPAGKQAQQFASHLKAKFPEAYEMTEEAILAEHATWTPPPAKPKEEKEDKPAESSEPKPKAARKPMSEEKKAEAAAKRKATIERKKAEAAAAKVVEEKPAEPAPKAEVPMPKAVEPPKAPASDLKPFPFKGKKCLLDTETNGLWLRNQDGSKGKWQGVLSEDKKSLDASIPEPSDD